PKLVITTATIFIVVLLGALRVRDLWFWRDQTLKNAEAHAGSVAFILSEYIRQVFAASDASLRQLAVHSRRVGGPAAPASEWAPILAAAQASLTGIGSLTVTDAQGIIRYSTQPRIIGQPRRGEYVFVR